MHFVISMNFPKRKMREKILASSKNYKHAPGDVPAVSIGNVVAPRLRELSCQCDAGAM